MNRRIIKVIGVTSIAVITFVALLLAFPVGANLDGNNNGVYCSVYCTQTQGGWGQVASGQNVGALRDGNWTAVPGGTLEVGIPGAAGFSMIFTSSAAVEAYLPAGGTPASLTQDHNNPTSTESGVFGGQVTALKLNVLFSNAGIGKIGPPCPLGGLEIKSGPFAGETVNSFLAIAEAVLGGDLSGLPSGATISNVSDAAADINENYVDCVGDGGFLE